MSFGNGPRKYLYEEEIEILIKKAGENLYGLRDQTMILVTFRHGLRASETCNMKWNQIDFHNCRMHVQRTKGSVDSVQPIRDREIRMLKKLYAQRVGKFPYVFRSQRGTKLCRLSFYRMLNRLGKKTDINIDSIYPHMLRHATGYKLANENVCTRTIQDYLGHANIQNTVFYTRLSASKFDNLFLD